MSGVEDSIERGCEAVVEGERLGSKSEGSIWSHTVSWGSRSRR
jgi:hypothetical protein